MRLTKDLYQGSLTLLTDLYQLTMAYGYWKSGKAERQAVFNMFFRKNPFQGGFAIACGLEYFIDYLNEFRFTDEDIDYLRTLKGNDQQPLFEEGFLQYLKEMEFNCDVEAMPEGTLAFPHEPMVKVSGPILQCQLLETPLLNIINFQTLIATKAARIRIAAKDDPVLEFGLRRAHGIDGALAASRAAYIGGCNSTSNLMAGKLFGIPVAGTHAHSWIMSFDSELEAFKVYAEVMPNNCVFLVDTYDTLQGVANAIEVGKILREKGKEMVGIRIDSGDLAYFSQKARKMLDEAGFPDAKIVASNDLDEKLVVALKNQEAAINVWGIGTKLVTAYDQPALGAVYKLAAVQDENQKWHYTLKLSEQTLKINNPGLQQIKRFYSEEGMYGDMIYDTLMEPQKPYVMIDPMDPTKSKEIDPETTEHKELLVKIFEKGKQVYEKPTIEQIKAHKDREIASLHPASRRFVNPHIYPVGLEKSLHELKTELIVKLRKMKK
jgi:nicotinate phosphoribosyltransferase